MDMATTRGSNVMQDASMPLNPAAQLDENAEKET